MIWTTPISKGTKTVIHFLNSIIEIWTTPISKGTKTKRGNNNETVIDMDHPNIEGD